MSTTTLPKSLRSRLTTLGQRLHQQKVIRCTCRITLLMIGSALGVILLDALFGLPMWLRCSSLAAWLGLGVYEVRRFFREVLTEPIDAEGVACAVEQEYPRLAERLSTAVELAGSDDPANGSPELIADVVADVEIRTRKLDLQRAAMSKRTMWFAVGTGTVLFALLLLISFASGSIDQLRRFFIPFYTPKIASVEIGYRVVATSGDPTIKRGESTDLAGHLEAIKAGAELPTSATLILKSAAGSPQRLPMEFDADKGVVHLKQGPIDAGFEYCIESGQAASEWHKVSVVEPILLKDITATITPPAYAARAGEAPIQVKELGEIQALQYGKISWDVKFSRPPAVVWVEWKPNVESDKAPTTERTHLTVDETGRTTHQRVATTSGELRLIVDAGKAGTTFPAQIIRVIVDAPPKFEKVEGVSAETRYLRPDAKLPIDVTVTDDVAVAQLELEYRVNQGPIQKMPLPLKGLGGNRVSDVTELDVAGKAKENEVFEYRLVASDNRIVPEANLLPQQTYYPSETKWAEIRFSKSAIPLKVQDVLAKKKEVAERLKKIVRELEAEQRSTYKLKLDTARKSKLSPEAANQLDDVGKQVRETNDGLKELARDTAQTPDLGELAEELNKVADRELKDADASLNQARKEDRHEARTQNLDKADAALAESIRRLEKLRALNDRLAQARLDREELERILSEQQKIKDELDRAKNDPEQLAKLKERQQKLEDELKKLAEESDLVRQALKDAARENAEELAKQAQQLEQQQRDLNQAAKQTEKQEREKNTDVLLKKQQELAKKIKDLAEKINPAMRVGQVDPLQPGNAEKASEEIKDGRLDKAIPLQEKSAQELSRLAREIERNVQQSSDPRKATRQLQRLQRDLKDRMEDATKNKPLAKLTPEQKQVIQQEQEAIRKAVEKTTVPPEAAAAKRQVLDEVQKAQDALNRDDKESAEKAMDAAAKALDKLADQLPAPEKRLEQARKEIAKLKQEQEAVAKQAESATAALGKKDPDAVAAQRELSKKLAETAKKQAQIAEKLSKLDTPGHEDRRERTQEAMRKAQNDLIDGKPQDVAASQQAAKRELDRLEQALNGQTPADEKADQLAKKQKQIADESAQNAEKPNAAKTKSLQQQQTELQRELDKLPAQEAPAALDDAQRLSRKTESALRENNHKEAATQAEKTAQALQRLADQMNGRRTDREQAADSAKKQKQNAEEAEAAKNNPQAMTDAHKKAQQLQDEVNQLRPGEAGQKDKQKALDALKKAQQAKTPEELAKAEKEAEDALNDLAERLKRDPPRQAQERDAEALSRELAQKQRDLNERTREALEQASKKEGEEGKKATEEALAKAAEQQRALNKEASELPTRDTPEALEQAKAAMNRAEQAAADKQATETVKKQKEAAEALDRLAKQVGEQSAKKPAPGEKGSDSLPNTRQADEAKKLAEEQRQLRDRAAKTADEQAQANREPKENPVAPLAKEQEDIARKAEAMTKAIEQQQGEKGEGTKQAKQAADAAQQATNQLKNGDLDAAKQSGRQAAQKLEQMGQGSPDGKAGKEAAGLAKRQEELNKKLEGLGDDRQAAKAQQGERQEKLERDLDQLQKQLGRLAKQMKQQPGAASAGSKLEQGASHLQQAEEALKNAKQQAKQGKTEPAQQSREDASRAMELARQQAGEAAKQLGRQSSKESGEPKTGQALQQARDGMEKAQQELGQGKPGEAGKAMDQAAESLKKASQQIGKPSSPQSGEASQPGQSNEPSQNKGAGSSAPDLTPFQKILEKYPGKSWGELPGKVQTDVIQEMAARYGEEYARNIKLYFEQLAERK